MKKIILSAIVIMFLLSCKKDTAFKCWTCQVVKFNTTQKNTVDGCNKPMPNKFQDEYGNDLSFFCQNK